MEEKDRKNRGKRVKWTLIIVAVLAVAFLVCLMTVRGNMKSKYEAEIDTLKKTVAQTEKEKEEAESLIREQEEITSSTIESGLKEIGKLCTAEYYFTHVSNYESSMDFQGFTIPFTTSSFIYSYDGKILAGIDFDHIMVDKDDEKKRITVMLPEPEIISEEIDENSFRLYDEKNNVFNPISVENVADTNKIMIEDEEEKAIAEGLYDRASENAKKLIENFLNATYPLNDYKVVIR